MQTIEWSILFAHNLTEEYKPRKILVRKLIALGTSLHYRNSYGRTVLDSYMTDSNCDPFDSMLLGKFWLEALAKAGVDTLEYLREEIAISSIGNRGCRQLMYTLESASMVYWDWYSDSQGPAFDVLE